MSRRVAAAEVPGEGRPDVGAPLPAPRRQRMPGRPRRWRLDAPPVTGPPPRLPSGWPLPRRGSPTATAHAGGPSRRTAPGPYLAPETLGSRPPHEAPPHEAPPHPRCRTGATPRPGLWAPTHRDNAAVTRALPEA